MSYLYNQNLSGRKASVIELWRVLSHPFITIIPNLIWSRLINPIRVSSMVKILEIISIE